MAAYEARPAMLWSAHQPMDIAQLKYFIEVAEHGSFSRAAAALSVAQPFLSRQIRRLEVELHRHLFYRHGRGIWLTDAGENFLVTARSVVHQLELATEVTKAADSELTGRFSLGLTPSLARILTVPLVRAFTARFPLARLSIAEGLSRDLHERLLTERMDAAILHDQPASTLVDIEPVSGLTLCLIARRAPEGDDKATLPFVELASLPLIFPSPPHPLRSIVEAQAARSGIELDVMHDIDGVETILELVQEGFGYTVASANVVKAGRWADTLVAIPVTSPDLVTTLSLATPSRRPPSALQAMTLEVVRDVLRRVLPPA
ncbi:MAG: LysR family transcriptional regulator [Polaromonas sp.]|nr:LysR family transcriptional regulator [Polaromonas sp.]